MTLLRRWRPQFLFGGLAAFAERTEVDGPTLILIGQTAAEGALAGAEPLAPAHIMAA